MEQHLGRELTADETVDHINRDFTDDRIENLRIVSHKQHGLEDARRAKRIKVNCIWCGEELLRVPCKVRANAKQGKAGPFCESCGGKYGQQIRAGAIDKLAPQPSVETEYYYLDK